MISSKPKVGRVGIVTSIWLLIIALDQGSKLWARTVLTTTSEINLFEGLLRFTLVYNNKGFLGILENVPEPLRYTVLIFGVAALLIFAILWLYRGNTLLGSKALPLSFIIGGGVSNLIDRLLHSGNVTDYISLGIGHVRTGIFNLADVAILSGSFALGYLLVSPIEK